MNLCTITYYYFKGYLQTPSGIHFHLETTAIDETQAFTLTCNSTGGPVIHVNWTRNGDPVSEEWNRYSVVSNLTESSYHNWLTVPGQYEGDYQCTVYNNNPSSPISSSLSVYGKINYNKALNSYVRVTHEPECSLIADRF